jgi:hypothetical protein
MMDLQRYQFSDEEWAAVAVILGDLDGVEYVDETDDGFELVGFFDPDLLDEFRDNIKPATLDVIRAHIEFRLMKAQVSVWYAGKSRVSAEGEREIAEAAKKLLDLLPPIFGEESKWPGKNLSNTKRFRNDLAEVNRRAQIQADESEAWLRRPASRPPVPHFRIDFWEYLMRLWTVVLRRPATNSPGGDISRFIDAASAPARNILEPSQSKAHQFVKDNRARIWQKADTDESTFRLVKS